ncbi:MAG TPA: hypothetical protein EYP08_07825, partial [Pyrodictiaceae archaeon]|nr:hypothetical protein [Pyrodictiaceae archaeon]
IVRIDHFRGFYNYWVVPGDAETAVHGEWRDGPHRRPARQHVHQCPRRRPAAGQREGEDGRSPLIPDPAMPTRSA